MGYLQTIPEGQARGTAAASYRSMREMFGYVPNYVKAFSLRPELWDVWRMLVKTVASTEDEVESIATNPLTAGLSDEEQAVVDSAAKIAGDASTVSAPDSEYLERIPDLAGALQVGRAIEAGS